MATIVTGGVVMTSRRMFRGMSCRSRLKGPWLWRRTARRTIGPPSAWARSRSDMTPTTVPDASTTGMPEMSQFASVSATSSKKASSRQATAGAVITFLRGGLIVVRDSHGEEVAHGGDAEVVPLAHDDL